MKSYAFSLWLALTFLAACFFSVSCPAFGQSLTTGGVTGTVTDPSGAAVPNATVTLKNNDTGAAVSGVSNSTGAYRFALLNPGSYTVSVAAPGFSGVHQNVSVAVGQSSTVNVKLEVAAFATTVEVTAQGGVLQTDNGNVFHHGKPRDRRKHA